MEHRHLLFFALLALSSGAALPACAAPPRADGAESSEQGAVSDIDRMTARGDGTFDVTCHDGRHEIVSADDVTQGRVCKPAVFPSSPFAPGACVGTPMSEAAARARLGSATGPVVVGSFTYAIRHRTGSFTWNTRWSNGGHWDVSYSWADAPNDTFVAWRDAYDLAQAGIMAIFDTRGVVEMAMDQTGPYLRLVGRAAPVVGPDTTHVVRFVSRPMRPWATQAGPDFVVEESRNGGAWGPVNDPGNPWLVETKEGEPFDARRHRTWYFGNPATSIVTERCGQFTSGESTSSLSAIDAAIGVYLALD